MLRKFFAKLAILMTTACPLFAQDQLTIEPSEIGQVKISNNVSSSGAFQEKYQVATPSFGSVGPQIELIYSSGDRTPDPGAILGRGWRMAIPIISRKGISGGTPSFAESGDIFSLNGEPLLACADSFATNLWLGGYPAKYLSSQASASCLAGGNFTTQTESYSKILKNQDNTWTIWQKNGTYTIFAPLNYFMGANPAPHSTDDYLLNKGNWVPISVNETLSSSETRQALYDWQVADASVGYAFRLGQIAFGSYKVTFNYAETTTPTSYATGTPILGIQRYKLGSIAITDGQNKIRAFSLKYAESAMTKVNLLTEITEYGSNYAVSTVTGQISGGSALPPTIYTYNEESYSFLDSQYDSLGSTSTNPPVPVDFHRYPIVGSDLTGTGRDTLLWTGVDQVDDIEYERPIGCAVECHNSPAYETQHEAQAVQYYNPGFGFNFDPAKNIAGTVNFGDMDFLNHGPHSFNTTNGLNRLVGILPKSIDRAFEVLAIEQYLNGYRDAVFVSLSGNTLSDFARVHHSSGFGDQLLGFSLNTGKSLGPSSPSPAEKVTLEGTTASTSLVQNDLIISDPNNLGKLLSELDFNGDGLQDRVRYNFVRDALSGWQYYSSSTGDVEVSINHNERLSSLRTYRSNFFIGSLPKESVALGDFNGDGVSDYAALSNNSKDLQVALGTGGGITSKSNWATNIQFSLTAADIPSGAIPATATNKLYSAISVMDFNKDGLDDVVQMHGMHYERVCGVSSVFAPVCYHNPPFSVRVFLSTGRSFVPLILQGSAEPAVLRDFAGSGDFDGDGRLDVVGRVGTATTQYKSIAFGSGPFVNLMSSVATPEGNSVSVTYSSSRATD